MLRVIIGYIVCLAAASWRLALIDQTKTHASFMIELGLGMALTAIFTVVPWLICVLIGAAWRIRNPFYYIGFALLTQVAIFATLDHLFDPLHNARYYIPWLFDGATGGFVYWAIAGRFAGKDVTLRQPNAVVTRDRFVAVALGGVLAVGVFFNQLHFVAIKLSAQATRPKLDCSKPEPGMDTSFCIKFPERFGNQPLKPIKGD